MDGAHIDKWFFHPQGFYMGYSTNPDKSEKIPVDPVSFSKELLSFVTKK